MDTKGYAMSYVGSCFCGAVELEVSGEPEGMGYCHCSSCRSWSGGPVNAFSLWKPENVTVTKGADRIALYQKTEVSQRQYCAECGGHLMTNHPPLGLVDKLRLGATIVHASRVTDWRRLEGISAVDWLRRWSGRRTLEKIWVPLLRAKEYLHA